jgi:hypothetical protein
LKRGLVVFSGKSEGAFSKLFLLILKLAVYSNSTFLTMSALALYGLITGVASVPRKRASAMKSLLRYGVSVFQHALGSQKQVQQADKRIARKLNESEESQSGN